MNQIHDLHPGSWGYEDVIGVFRNRRVRCEGTQTLYEGTPIQITREFFQSNLQQPAENG